jgi:hypothetical protein
MGVFQNNLMGAAAAAASAGGADFYEHQIANSCRYQDSANSHMYVSMGTATNVDKYTFSTWFKHCDWTNGEGFVFSIGSGTLENLRYTYDSGAANFYGYVGDNSSYQFKTNAAFRDPSSWYHIVFTYDSTQSTAADRVKLYINGVSQTWATNTYENMSQNQNSNSDQGSLYVNRQATWASGTSNEAYFAETIFVDGTGYAASDFGEEKNGVWIPKDPSGLSFGNNGFYLKYESSSDLGNDSSGNNNDLTVGAISAHDQMLDSPTFNSDSNGGNYATWNPLNAGSYTTLAECNLKVTGTSSGASNPSGTFAMTSGKWYWEMLVVDEVSSYPYTGLTVLGNITNGATDGGDIWAMRYDPGSPAVQANSTAANILGLGTITVVNTGVQSVTDGDIISYYLDCDNRKAWIAKNGSIPNSGDPANGTNPQWSWTTTPNNPITFTAQIYNGDDTILNAGQDGTFAGEKTAQGNSDDTGYGNFYYDPPTGFLAMCSGNLPVADAVDPAQTDDDYPQKLFNTIIYTGDNGGSFTTGFQPDLVWVKRRDGDQSNGLWDSSRGTTKILISNEQDAEGTSSGLTSFDSTGYTMGTYYNQTGNTYVSWSWRANGGSSSNSDGATSSTVQAAPGGGFSIVTYTGFAGASGTSTVGHGMGVAPNMIIYKSRSRGSGWWTAAPGLFSSQSHFIDLNGTGQPTDLSSYGTMSAPTTSVFSINGVDGVGGESATYVAYCFANIEGFCKVGTYAGNGNTDGAFIYTGFKPKFILFKRTNRSGDFWYIIDPVRNPYNGPGSRLLNADRGVGESGNATTDVIDIVSNGFKMRTSGSGINGSGGEWIWLAMAHNPFKYATAR